MVKQKRRRYHGYGYGRDKQKLSTKSYNFEFHFLNSAIMQEDFSSNREKDQKNNLSLTTFQSDDLLEKLKMLNFESHLLREHKIKSMAKFYFVKSVNPGEQFFMFTLICWWLCRKLGKDMEKPQESDDPNTVILKIMKILEEIDMPIDFQPNKLMRGAGPICLLVLDCLATQALKVVKITCQRPYIAEEDEAAIEYLEDNAEIILEKLVDEQNATYSDDSDTELDNLNNFNWFSRKPANEHKLYDNEYNDQYSTAENFSDQQQWRLELERNLPQLKVFVKTDVRDWRSHISQMEILKFNIDAISDETQMQLKKLHSEFTYSLDKVESREKHLNNELHTLIRQFKETSIELSTLQYAQTQIQKDTDDYMTQLKEVVLENDIKKTEMEKRGQSMSDGSSLLHIKKAIAKLKDDVSQLNLEVALLGHSIDQEVLRQSTTFIE